MITFKRLCVNDLVYIKNAEFDLDYSGITVVRGVNKNARVQRNNGAGKSLLFSSIPNVIGYSNPTTAAKNVRSVFGKDTEITLTFDDKKVVKRAKGKGNSFGFELTEGGKLLNESGNITNKNGQEIVTEWIPISEDEFYTFCYLDSRRLSTLHMGTPVNRYNFISDLFRLSDFDSMKKWLETQAKEVEHKGIQLSVLKDQYKELKTAVQVDIEELRTKEKTLTEKAEALKSKSDGYFEELRVLEKKSAFAKDYQAVKEVLETYGVSASSLVQRVKETRKKESGREAYLRYKKELKKYKAAKQKYDEKMAELRPFVAKAERICKGNPLRKALEFAQRQQKQHEKAVEHNERVKKAIERVNGVKRVNIEKERDKLVQLKATVSKESVVIKAMRKLEGETSCPTCQSPLKSKDVKRMLLEAETAKEKAENLMVEVEKRIGRYEELEDDFELADTALMESKDYSDAINVLWKAVEAESINLGVSKPEPVPTVEEDVSTELEALERALVLLPKYEGFSPELLAEKEAKYKAYQKIQSKLSAITSQIPSVQITIAEYEKNKAKLSELRENIARHKEEVQYGEVYDWLIKAYSNKGIKSIIIKNLARTIEKHCNQFSSLLFLEPFKFECVVEKNQFFFNVHRKAGKKTIVSDVKDLSGSESRAFNLLLVRALLPLVPSHRRANFIVLDEMTSHMDEVTKNLVLNNFLPELNSVVPHVIFIDVYNDNVPNARELYVVKQGNESRLVAAEEIL